MSGIKKYVNITGLNTGHSLYSKVAKFLNFDDTITCLKTGTTYTSTSAITEDDLLGKGRSFTANTNVVSPTVPVGAECTVLAIYRHTGANTGGTSSDSMLFQLSSGNTFALSAGSWSSYDYRVLLRGNFGTTYYRDYKPYAGVVTEKQKIHATALDYAQGVRSFYQNGVEVPLFGSTGGTPTFTPSANPIQVTVAPVVGTTGSFILSGFVVFNTLLTDAEKAEVTTNPWDLTNGNMPLVASVNGTLKPNTLITATLANYPVYPTTVTLADARTNSITLPLTDIGGGQYTFTVPDLATSTVALDYIQYGNINLTFGAKTIVGLFEQPIGKSYVTLINPVATNAFESWGTDVPVVGEQLTSNGNFDVYGNFTGADPDATYDCWITRLNGDNHKFTVRLGTASPPVTSTSTRYSLIFDPIQPVVD
jgi:hypothetical protein